MGWPWSSPASAISGIDAEPGQTVTDQDLRLRPATAEDRFRIRAWFARREAGCWWGTAAGAEAEITLAMSSPSALCRTIERGGTPVGYAQAIDAGLWEGPQPEDLAPGTWDTRALLASPAGIESPAKDSLAQVLALLAGEVFATTLAVACSGLVPVRCEAAVRAYEQAGFRWLRVCPDASLGPAWLMLRERPR
jgi:hypothetical protein